VAAGPPNGKRNRQLDLGGVLYEITVSSFGDMYRADWTCSECGEAGCWSPVSQSFDQAIESARIAIQVHQSLAHENRMSKSRRRSRGQ
jgi:hypothetical protein